MTWMYQAAVSQVHGNFNQIVFWSRLPDWKNQTLTPNPNAIYLMPFINTKDVGPMVLEIPPVSADGSITGNLDDAWQVALEDIGPAGADKGKGGKYLILPPGYKQKVPAGYLPMPSDTYQNYALLRSIPHSGSEDDIAKALSYGKRVKLYPLSQAANPAATVFLDASNVVYDSTIPYDLRYFQSLNRIVQAEPWLERDKVMIDQLKSIGIEKDKPFNPDAATQDMLKEAAVQAHTWLDARYETLFTPYFEGTHWVVPAAPDVIAGQSNFCADPNSYAVDSRAVTYSIGYIGIKHLGGGQFYLMTSKDKAPASRFREQRRTASPFLRMLPRRNIGQRQCMTALHMLSSATCSGPAALPMIPRCRKTRTAQWIFTLRPRLRPAKTPTGFPSIRTESLKSSFVCMDPRSRSSIRPGSYPISRKFSSTRDKKR